MSGATIVALIWAGLVALVFGLAAHMEWIAIRDRINGANGLIYLVAGFVGLASVPVGFVLLWIFGSFTTALLYTLAVAAGGALLWRGLLQWLGRVSSA